MTDSGDLGSITIMVTIQHKQTFAAPCTHLSASPQIMRGSMYGIATLQVHSFCNLLIIFAKRILRYVLFTVSSSCKAAYYNAAHVLHPVASYPGRNVPTEVFKGFQVRGMGVPAV
jgi:hypothetical protein